MKNGVGMRCLVYTRGDNLWFVGRVLGVISSKKSYQTY
ncbi:hypothetical protein SAMN05443253_1093 [Bacillus sp. OK048]|nr:hypothetical protein SAMN05443253_1093 [Bacillus sp. OK048]